MDAYHILVGRLRLYDKDMIHYSKSLYYVTIIKYYGYEATAFFSAYYTNINQKNPPLLCRYNSILEKNKFK